MDPAIVYLMEELPSEIYQGLMYYTRYKMPYKKYQRRDFTLCLLNCASTLTYHYKIKVTEQYKTTLRKFIEELVNLFEHYLTDPTPESQETLGALSQITLSSTYDEFREKPPPI